MTAPDRHDQLPSDPSAAAEPSGADTQSAAVDWQIPTAQPTGTDPVDSLAGSSPAAGSVTGSTGDAEWASTLERLRHQGEAHLEMVRRAQVELANYRKRIARQETEQLERAAEGLLRRLLPVVDALDAAAREHPQAAGLVRDLLAALLAAEGAERIEPVGQRFDPAVAEAVEHHGDGETQVVDAVLRPGFAWKGRLLRPALVSVRSVPLAQLHAVHPGPAGHAGREPSGTGAARDRSERR